MCDLDVWLMTASSLLLLLHSHTVKRSTLNFELYRNLTAPRRSPERPHSPTPSLRHKTQTITQNRRHPSPLLLPREVVCVIVLCFLDFLGLELTSTKPFETLFQLLFGVYTCVYVCAVCVRFPCACAHVHATP